MVSGILERWREDARPLWRGAAFASVTLGMGAIAETHMLLTGEAARTQVWDFYYRRWACVALRAAGVTLLGSPIDRSAPARARLVVANHRSPLDITVLIAHFGGHILSRADVAHWPIVGRSAQIAGTIFVDRQNKSSGARAIRQIREALRGGRTVSIFPEGTTFAGDEVRPFQAGGFVAAKGLDVDIVPVGLAYPPGAEWTEPTFVGHVRRVARRREIPVAAVVGTPFKVSTNPSADAERATREVQVLVGEARALVTAHLAR